MSKAKPAKILAVAIMLLITIITMFPFYMMFIMGTYTTEVIQQRLVLLPGPNLVENWNYVFGTRFMLYYWNSFFIAVVTTIGGVIISAMAGYGFAKFYFKGKQFLFIIVIATLMLPTQLGLVGFVMQMRYMKLFNSHWALILPPMANAFHVYWMTTYIRTGVPTEIIESGRIDGCGEHNIFLKLVFPLIRPATITVTLLAFLVSWNSYFLPLVVLNEDKKYTIPLGIMNFSTLFRKNYAASILALTLAVIPIILMFGFFSKHLISGLTSGSVKE